MGFLFFGATKTKPCFIKIREFIKDLIRPYLLIQLNYYLDTYILVKVRILLETKI